MSYGKKGWYLDFLFYLVELGDDLLGVFCAFGGHVLFGLLGEDFGFILQLVGCVGKLADLPFQVYDDSLSLDVLGNGRRRWGWGWSLDFLLVVTASE